MKAAAVSRRPHTPTRQTDATATTFAVECQKTATGAWTVFKRYATRAEAHAVANRLRELGAATRVVAAS